MAQVSAKERLSAEVPAPVLVLSHHRPLHPLLKMKMKTLRYLSTFSKGLLKVFIIGTCFMSVDRFDCELRVQKQHLPDHLDDLVWEVVADRLDQVRWHQDRLLRHQLDAEPIIFEEYSFNLSYFFGRQERAAFQEHVIPRDYTLYWLL